MKKFIKAFGFEVEGVAAAMLERDEYHNYNWRWYEIGGKKIKYRLERDGSIRPEDGYGFEFITGIMYSENEIDYYIDAMRDVVGDFYINQNCGLHMHLSGDWNKRNVDILLLQRLLRKEFKKFKAFSDAFDFEYSYRRFFRRYAKRIRGYKYRYSQRYLSINSSVYDENRVEIRSYNFVNLRDYEALKKILHKYFEIANTCIALSLVQNKYYEFEYSFSNDEEEENLGEKMNMLFGEEVVKNG